MLTYLLSPFSWYSLLSQLVFGLMISAFVALPLVVRRKKWDAIRDPLAISFAMSMLGLVTGFLTGLSRAPAVGAVLPAMLTLIGGLVLLFVGRETDATRRRLVALSTAVL